MPKTYVVDIQNHMVNMQKASDGFATNHSLHTHGTISVVGFVNTPLQLLHHPSQGLIAIIWYELIQPASIMGTLL